jgi:hypothetical protein
MSATPANNENEIYLAVITHGDIHLRSGPGGTAVMWRGPVEHLLDVVKQLTGVIEASRVLAGLGGQSCAWDAFDVDVLVPRRVRDSAMTDEGEYLLFTTPLCMRYHSYFGAGVLCAVDA